MSRDPHACLAGLRDSRQIFIDGRRVADVTTDPTFRGAGPRRPGCIGIRPTTTIA